MSAIEGIEFSYSIPEDKYEDIIIHLRNNFFADEPLNKSVQLCKPGEPHKDLEAHSYKTLEDNYSIVAYEKGTGEIAGVVLNGIIHKGDYETEIEKLNLVSDKRFKQIFSFLFTTNESVDLFNKYNTDNIFESRILSVDSRFRRKGIANELLVRTVELAQKNGFQILKADATSIFSQKVLERSGFETIHEVFYKNYTNEDGEVIFNTTEPHTSLKIMIKYLKE